jgi:hypothetical protein
MKESSQEKSMDQQVKESFDNLASTDDTIRMSALQAIIELTEDKVDWVYEVWDDLIQRLNHPNSYQRIIAILVLCNLAKSDTQHRLDNSLDHLLAHTKDDKFVTSRKCLQIVWKLAAASPQNQAKVLDHLEKRFRECEPENHSNLLRQDILQSVRCLYDQEKDEGLLIRAGEWLLDEKEEKYRKQYAAILKVN